MTQTGYVMPATSIAGLTAPGLVKVTCFFSGGKGNYFKLKYPEQVQILFTFTSRCLNL